jgi:RecA-family ATPase
MADSLAFRAEREFDEAYPSHSAVVERQKLWLPNENDRFSMGELHTAPSKVRTVIDPFLPAGCAAVLTGAGGTSKTGLNAVMAISIATDSPFFGHHVTPGSVLHISAEDRREMFHRHIYANSRHLNDLQLALVAERVYVKDVVGLGFTMTWTIDGHLQIAEDIGQLVEYAREIPDLRLITLDTLSRLNGGEETNEDLSVFVTAMERIARETGAAVLASHHAGKAQMRADANDQYAGRGGSALSDNARSVMHLSRLTVESNEVPSNAQELIAQGLLLRLSHVKSNYLKSADDLYFESVITPHAAQLRAFAPEFAGSDAKAVWEKLKTWFVMQTDVQYPTSTTIDTLGKEFGSRADKRRAIAWAADRNQLVELAHPHPKARRKHYYALPSVAFAEQARDYRSASDGE